MEQKTQKVSNQIWEARIVLTFQKSKIKLNVLVLGNSKASAEETTVEWAKKYVDDNRELISNKTGYDVCLVKTPLVQAFKTSYSAFIKTTS